MKFIDVQTSAKSLGVKQYRSARVLGLEKYGRG